MQCTRIVWLVLLAGIAGGSLGAQQQKKEGPVVATLKVSPSRADPGQRIELRLTVTNRSAEEVLLLFRTGQKYDFAITRERREVWRWSHGRVFTQAVTQLKLKAGESRSFEESWDQTDNEGDAVARGDYSVTGILTTRPEICSAPVAVRIGRRDEAREGAGIRRGE